LLAATHLVSVLLRTGLPALEPFAVTDTASAVARLGRNTAWVSGERREAEEGTHIGSLCEFIAGGRPSAGTRYIKRRRKVTRVECYKVDDDEGFMNQEDRRRSKKSCNIEEENE